MLYTEEQRLVPCNLNEHVKATYLRSNKKIATFRADNWTKESENHRLRTKAAIHKSKVNPKNREKSQATRVIREMKNYSQPRMNTLNARIKAKNWPPLDFDKSFLDIKLAELDWSCECCGKRMKIRGTNQDPDTWSVDRVDATKCCSKGNIALICWRCNHIKQNGTAAEHETIARYIRAKGLP